MRTKTWYLVLQKYKSAHSRAAFCPTAISSGCQGSGPARGTLPVLRTGSTPRIPPAPSSDNQAVTKPALLGASTGSASSDLWLSSLPQQRLKHQTQVRGSCLWWETATLSNSSWWHRSPTQGTRAGGGTGLSHHAGQVNP